MHIKTRSKTSINKRAMNRFFLGLVMPGMLVTLAACSGLPSVRPLDNQAARSSGGVAAKPVASAAVLREPAPIAAQADGVINQPKSRWLPVAWSDLPGFEDDNLSEAWGAWLKSCEKPALAMAALCGDVRRLSISTTEEQRNWMRSRLQPYRVESLDGDPNGLLTGYFEPMLEASATPTATFTVPLYPLPAGLAQRNPWFSRQEIDTLPQAQAALQNKAIAYVEDPIDALVLQIQGSGRLHMAQPDGSAVWVRLSYAGTNGQPYRSLGRWLLDQGLVKDASWPGIKAWLAQNPARQQELLWRNPRVTFFKMEWLSDMDAAFGPRGSQGVALTAGRSIAVDQSSIPYGAVVWLASAGSQVNLQRLVLAQDSGHAVTGAVRADYFVGSGLPAGELAGRLRQPLQLWVLWPK